jgi:hypothetical protein
MPEMTADHGVRCLCEDCTDLRLAKSREPGRDWISKTLAFPNGDAHQCRLWLQGDSPIVVQAAIDKIAKRVGRPVSLGQAVELLCAEYLAAP